jgi:ComF family protein
LKDWRHRNLPLLLPEPSLGWLARGCGRLAARVAASLWPPVCLLSDARVDRSGAIAPELWQALDFLGADLCACCGVPVSDAVAGLTHCPVCQANPPALDAARAALVYDDASRPLVLGLKHGNRQDGLPVFANWMAGALATVPDLNGNKPVPDWHDALIVPVPSHWTRIATRGYNQAGRLARALASLPARQGNARLCLDLLVKSRRTDSQKGKTAAGRARNVQGSFAVHRRQASKVKGATVLLVDDVYTTGATLNACARVLKRAGAARVLAVTLARVVRPVAISMVGEGNHDDPVMAGLLSPSLAPSA